MNKYFSFNGIAARQEYWAMIVLTFVSTISSFVMLGTGSTFLILMAFILAIATIWYNLATSVRRIRDSGQNVLWIIGFFLPYLGFLVMLAFGFLESAEKES